MIIVSILIVAAILILEGYRAVKEEKKFTRRLYEDYESLFQKDYSLERFAKLGSYYSRHRKPGQIDDGMTWGWMIFSNEWIIPFPLLERNIYIIHLEAPGRIGRSWSIWKR